MKTVTGDTLKIPASLQTNIAQVMVSVREAEGLPLCEQQMIFAGKRVTDDVTQTLEELKAGDGSTLHLVIGACFATGFLQSDWSPSMTILQVSNRVRGMLSS